MRAVPTTFLAGMLVLTLSGPAKALKADPGAGSLNANAKQVFAAAMRTGDRQWDPQAKLLRVAMGGGSKPGFRITVRASAWYALGLLLRDSKGDNARAIETLKAVLAEQYHAPGKPWDGTFRRNVNEPDPPANAVMWRDYDPNWREFIGTTFAMILEEYPDRIPHKLAQRMNDSIARAVEGEIKNKRLEPTYTNPALMYAFLWNYAAVRGHRADWMAESTAWQDKIYDLFKKYGSFNEYNSPTYCGVDLYALGLWRSYGSTVQMRTMGSEMEAELWRDLAAFYNPDLKNLSGPFDRSYGMNMEDYVSVVGLALRDVLDARLAPFPTLGPSTDHVGDLWFAPEFAILGVRIPPDAMQRFVSFQGDRLVRRQITAQRIATAWIGSNVMYGGEITDKTVGIKGHSQFHSATVQWKMPDGKIGWIELSQFPPLNAVADKNGLKISCSGDVRFRIHVDGIDAVDVKQAEWVLPGLMVRVTTDARSFTAESNAQTTEVEYVHITGIDLVIRSTLRASTSKSLALRDRADTVSGVRENSRERTSSLPR